MNELPPFTSAIVPVHDAQATVARVVSTLLASDLVDEVVCVDAGSTDESLAILRRFGRDIVLVEPSPTRHRGKGEALAEGVWRANGTIVLFIDAGLTTLTEAHLRALVEPLYERTVRAVLGCSPGASPFSNLPTRLTGARSTSQRAYLREDLLRHLVRMARTGAAVEVYLDGVFKNKEVLVVPLAGLRRLGNPGHPGRIDEARASVGRGPRHRERGPQQEARGETRRAWVHALERSHGDPIVTAGRGRGSPRIDAPYPPARPTGAASGSVVHPIRGGCRQWPLPMSV